MGAVIAVIAGGTIAGCSTNAPSTVASNGSPTLLSTTATSSSAAAPVTTVDAGDYLVEAGFHRWRQPGSPPRLCSIFTGPDGNTVECTMTFPAGTAPVTQAPFGVQAPNAIVLTARGTAATLTEGGPGTDPVLEVNHRIVVADIACTALPETGIDCVQGANGFRSDTATGLSTRGPIVAAATPTTTTAAPDSQGTGPWNGTDGPYTDATTPVAPGTTCGAATGRTVVTVARGSISCVDAIAVIDRYRGLPPGDYGNANIRSFDGWQCSSPTAVMSQELGFGSKCERGDVVVTTAR